MLDWEQMESNLVINYCYKAIKYNNFTWEECAEMLNDNLYLDVTEKDVEAEFSKYPELMEYIKKP